MRIVTSHIALGALALGLALSLPLSTSAQGVPVEASSVVPTATVLFDTSGGMEFLPGMPAGPAVCNCVNPPEDAGCAILDNHRWPLVRDGGNNLVPITPVFAQSGQTYTFDTSVYASSRTRHHYAIEALGGRIQNFFCAWDYRDSEPTRVDQLRPDRPQGIPHARPCSFDPDAPPMSGETPEAYLARSCGTEIQQSSDGIISQNSDLVYFALATFDSFREPEDTSTGMFSYACDPNRVQGGTDPGPGDPNADCMGIRRPPEDGEVVPGGLSLPDLRIDGELPEQSASRVRNTLRTIVPYWATPLSPAFHDLWYMLAYEPTFVDDPQASCRPHNVIFLGDAVPTFEVCWESIEAGVDPLPPGCERYWYESLNENLRLLHDQGRRVPGEPSDYEIPVRIFPIGFGLTGEELAASRLGDLSRYTGTGDERIIDVPEDVSIPVPADDPNLWLAENVAQFQSDLGRALSAILSSHVVSRSVPHTTTSVRGFTYDGQASNERVVMSRFRGVTNIDPRSPYWTGDVERFDWICAPDADGRFEVIERVDAEGTPLVSKSYAESLDLQIDFPNAEAEGREDRRVYTNFYMNSCAVGDNRNLSGSNAAISPFTGTPGISVDTLTGGPDGTASATPLTSAEITAEGACPSALMAQCNNLLNGALIRLISTLDAETSDEALCMGKMNLERVEQRGWIRFAIDADDITGDASLINYATGATENPEAAAAARRIVQWVRGASLGELLDMEPENPPPYGANYNEDRERGSAMGAVLFSSPVVVGPPSFGLPFQGYQDFLDGSLDPTNPEPEPEDEVDRVRSRRPVLYVSSDNGTVHAFDAATGDEIWSFVPRAAWRGLRRIVRARTPIMEGSPVVRDMRVWRGQRPEGDTRANDLWRTILVSGMRNGGRGYFAIDITNPDRPTFLWQLDSYLDPQLGMTYGQPALATVALDAATCQRVNANLPNAVSPEVNLDVGFSRPDTTCQRGVAILPGGVHPDGLNPEGGHGASNIGKVLYVVDVMTGIVLGRHNTIVDPLGAQSAARGRCAPDNRDSIPAGEGRCVDQPISTLPFCHADVGPACAEGFECINYGYDEVEDLNYDCVDGSCFERHSIPCYENMECPGPNEQCLGREPIMGPDPSMLCAGAFFADDQCAVTNACGSCGQLPANDGDPCGIRCGEFACDSSSGELFCSESSETVLSNNNNCGECGNQCESGQHCIFGNCVQVDQNCPDPNACGDCIELPPGLLGAPCGECGDGQITCNQFGPGLACTGFTDISSNDSNCGGCGPQFACSQFETCVNGECAPRRLAQAGRCYDSTTSPTVGDSCLFSCSTPGMYCDGIVAPRCVLDGCPSNAFGEMKCSPSAPGDPCFGDNGCQGIVDFGEGRCADPALVFDCNANGLCTTPEPRLGYCVPEAAEVCTSNLDCGPDSFDAVPAPITGSVAAFDTFAANAATRAFVGDAEGRMLRMDLSSTDPEDWRLEIFFDPSRATEYDGIETLTTEEEEILARGRPILYRPNIAYLDNLSDAVIVYGQGDVDSLSRVAVGEVGQDNLIFSLVERARFDADGLLEATLAQVNWILRMGVARGIGADRAEILTVQPRIFNRVVYFATYVEDDDPCRMGDPRLYGIHYTGPLYVAESPDGLERFIRLDEPIDDAVPGERVHSIVGMLPAPEGEKAFFYEAEDDDGALVQTRSVINSLDIVQLPSCFDPGGEGFGSESGSAFTPAEGTGEFQLFISASRAGDPESASAADRQARQVQTSLSLERPMQPALPTSWGTVVPW